MYHTRKRSFSQQEIEFIKKITKTDPPKTTQTKKPKIEKNSEDKPPLSITFIGNLDQPFSLNDPVNKQYLRAKIINSAPQWNLHIQFVHITIDNADDIKQAKKTIKLLAEIQKTTKIGVLVILPGADTNVTFYSEYLTELYLKITPLVSVGVQTLINVDLAASTEDVVKTYQAYMLLLYQMFMEKIPRINVINLMQPAEYRPKTKVNSFLDRMAGRIKQLIPDITSFKTALKESEAKAANGVIDYGNAEQQQAFKNLSKPIQANGATFLRSNSMSASNK